jgi:riboflavin kinase/FMN adenylyltransferase
VATQLIRGLINLPAGFKGCAATIGNFDGVHRGHQALLGQVKMASRALGVPSVVITFEPQPAEFFAGGLPRLTRWREKFAALAASGIDYVVVLRFNRKLAALDAMEFIQAILVDKLHVRHVVVGDDFRFGKARQGDFDFLKMTGRTLGFTVEKMPSFTLQNERVSSTQIRRALAAGDHGQVTLLLGRPYTMKGRIVKGDQRGRTLGFPTANIYLHRPVAPLQGVYSVRLYGIAEDGLPGVANLGSRPSVDGTRMLLEVHLFDFEQDIYGRSVCVEFCKKLRDEKRYDSIDLLKEQIAKDAAAARAYFTEG